MAHFYSVVTRESKDQEFAQNRQIFLTEQGYRYQIQSLESGVLELEEESAQDQSLTRLGTEASPMECSSIGNRQLPIVNRERQVG